MKSLLLTVLALTLAQVASAASLVSVKVNNPTDRDFRISYVTDVMTGKKRIFQVKLREDNTASFELALPGRTELLMRYDGVEIPLFIGPDDELTMEFDYSSGLGSVKFGGSAAEDNSFLAAYATAFPVGGVTERGGGFLPFDAEVDVLAEAAMGDVESFDAWVDAQLAAKRALIGAYGGKVDERLTKRYGERARYQAEVQKITFLVQNQSSMSKDDISAAARALDIYGLPENGDPSRLQDDDFKNYLKAYAQYLILPNSGRHDETSGDHLFETIQVRVDRPWRHYLQSELLVNAFDFLGNPDFGLDRYTAMKMDGAQEVFRQRVELAYGDVLNLLPGALAPNIGMYNEDGEPLSLTDLSGKVVYISFWASWCKPCLQNFKKYDTIRAQMEQKGIVLLNVDIDDDEFDWKKTLGTTQIRGLNVRGTHLKELKRAYNLVTIPAYTIIDREGRIVVLPEGENRDLLAAFDEILRS